LETKDEKKKAEKTDLCSVVVGKKTRKRKKKGKKTADKMGRRQNKERKTWKN